MVKVKLARTKLYQICTSMFQNLWTQHEIWDEIFRNFHLNGPEKLFKSNIQREIRFATLSLLKSFLANILTQNLNHYALARIS